MSQKSYDKQIMEFKEKRTLTSSDVARHCGVNFRTVLRWIERGWLRAYQLPGRGDNRIEIEDFLAFLREHKMPIPAAFHEGRPRVLIVDDDPRVASSLERVFKRADFDTQVATDGFQAGAKLGTFAPALMTLDLKMPGMDGMDVLRYVKSTPQLAGIKILVLSAMPQAELALAIKAGADDALAKPVKPDALLTKARELLDDHPRREGVHASR